MASLSKELELDVYRCCVAIFSDKNPPPRREKKIREILERNRGCLKQLDSTLRMPQLVECVKGLINKGVLSSQTVANEYFSSAVTPAAVKDGQSNEMDSDDLDSGEEQNPSGENVTQLASYKSPLGEDGGDAISTPLLYCTQHLILTTIQNALEKCCFDHCSRNAPAVIEAGKWQCAEAVELNKWASLLKEHRLMPSACPEKLLHSAITIRHITVHRKPLNLSCLLGLMRSAAELAKALNGHEIAKHLHRMSSELEDATKASHAERTSMRRACHEDLSNIRRRQRALLEQESECLAKLHQHDINTHTSFNKRVAAAVGMSKPCMLSLTESSGDGAEDEGEIWADCQGKWE